jgi:glycosyltransferase involved in cell wall biosynthesis
MGKKQVAFLNKHCRFWQVFPLRERTFFSSLPYYFSCWVNKQLNDKIKALGQEHEFAKVRVEFTQIAYLLKYLPKNAAKIFVGYDISWLSFARRMGEKTNWRAKIFPLFNVGQIAFYEKYWLPKYDEVVAVSKHDQKLFRQMFRLKNVKVENNGLAKIDLMARKKTLPLKIGYIGATSHPPNRTAIEYIVEKILPQLEKQKIDYRLILAGDNQDLKIENPKVELLGMVGESRSFFEQIDYLVAPIFAGSGTRIKILEGLGFGVPVITTKIGAEGIEIKSPYLRIVEDDEWVRAIEEAGGNFNVREKNALKKQLQKYLWRESFEGS